MSNNKKLQIALVSLFVLLLGGAIYFGYQSAQPSAYSGSDDGEVADSNEAREPSVSPRTDGRLDPEGGDIFAGGVERPATDLAIKEDEGSILDRVVSENIKELLDYGATPGVPIDANEQVAAVAEAIKTGRNPERLSVGVAGATARSFDSEKFDPQSAAYDADYRAAYLGSPEPGRVWFPAQPGEGVDRIQPLMPSFVKVEQGKDITLRVSGRPGQPVTFTSFDLGFFENQLTTITVVANDQGVAEARFQGPPGTISDVNILAASPVLSGRVRLTVHVTQPEKPGGSIEG